MSRRNRGVEHRDRLDPTQLAAQKLVLNVLSTGAMILNGKTYGNLMVDGYARHLMAHRPASDVAWPACLEESR